MNISQNKQAFAAAVLAVACVIGACSRHDGQVAQTAAAPARPATSLQPAPVPKLVTYNPDPVSDSFPQCNIETFDQIEFQGGPIKADLAVQHSVAGWVHDPRLEHPDYWLRLEDKSQGRYLQLTLKPSISRPDVTARESGDSNSLLSGFTLAIPAQALPGGNYHMYIAAVSGERTSVCDNGRYIELN